VPRASRKTGDRIQVPVIVVGGWQGACALESGGIEAKTVCSGLCFAHRTTREADTEKK